MSFDSTAVSSASPTSNRSTGGFGRNMERNPSFTDSQRERMGESFSGNSIVRVVQNGLLESEGKLSVGIDFG